MEKLNINEETFISFFINEVKEHSQSSGVPPLTAFKNLIESYYHFSIKHIKGIKTLSLKQYYDNFSKFILSELSYFDFVSDECFNLIIHYYRAKVYICKLDNDFLDDLRCVIKKEQEHINELETRTKEIMQILGKQYWPDNLLYDIVELSKLKNISLESDCFIINIFNYGYIEGKRAERAKRKHSTQYIPV